MASIEFILVNFNLSVHFALKLADIPFVSELGNGGSQQSLQIDDSLADADFNLFWDFDPAI